MKKLISILALFGFSLLSVGNVQQYHSVVARKKAAGATLQEDLGDLGGTGQNLGLGSTTQWVSSQFTASGTYTLTRIDVSIKKINSPSYTITAHVYSNTSNSPLASLASSTNTVSGTSVTTSYALYQFDFTGVSISSATKYHIVLTTSGTNGVDYFLWETESSGGRIEVSSDGSSWLFNSSAEGKADVYGN